MYEPVMILYSTRLYCKGTVRILAVRGNNSTEHFNPTSVHLITVRLLSLLQMYMLYFCTITLIFAVYKPYVDILYTTSVALYFNGSERYVSMRAGNVRCGFLYLWLRLIKFLHVLLVRTVSLNAVKYRIPELHILAIARRDFVSLE